VETCIAGKDYNTEDKMRIDKFGLTVQGGREVGDGYVEINHEQEYKLRLSNWTNSRADVKVEIDGTEVGVWRLDGWDTVEIERPANVQKKFTALLRDSTEGDQAGLSQVSRQNLGLIVATFMPEMPPLLTVNNREVSYGWAIGDVSGYNTYVDTASAYSPKGTSTTKSLETASMGTGLGQHSNQQFSTVAPLQTDPATYVTISLRLVQRKSKYTPLVESRANPVPPPPSTIKSYFSVIFCLLFHSLTSLAR